MTVICAACRRTARVTFGVGWPACHGQTMRLVKTREDVEEAVRQALEQNRFKRRP